MLFNSTKVLYSTGKPKVPQAPNTRQVSSKPEKILDAPGLIIENHLSLWKEILTFCL